MSTEDLNRRIELLLGLNGVFHDAPHPDSAESLHLCFTVLVPKVGEDEFRLFREEFDGLWQWTACFNSVTGATHDSITEAVCLAALASVEQREAKA